MDRNTPAFNLIETSRLRLKPLSANDTSTIKNILTEKVCKHIPEMAWPVSAADWVEEKLKGDAGYFCHGVYLRQSDTFIGFVQMFNGISNLENTDYGIELGFWLGEPYWGHGYCSEILTKITEIIEHNKWTQEVIALVYDGNTQCERVLLKNKFRNSGIPRTTKFGKVNVFVYESEHYRNTNN